MRVIVVGLGVQGHKRRDAAGADFVATVDPVNGDADYRTIEQVPLADYDAALVCTPDEAKEGLLDYLLSNAKHCLVEKPLFAAESGRLRRLGSLAKQKGVVCYTAYNHRFEPHFVRLKGVIESGSLGEIYGCRLFYGNGTARLVRESDWRDKGGGVLPDLGSHLLDTALFWFGQPGAPFQIVTASRFENRAFDHATFQSVGKPLLQMEVSLLSWRNHFYADITAEKGSAHIQSLCKWGPSSLTLRRRKLPSGRPDEQVETLVQPDPTWTLEYAHFKSLCADPAAAGHGNIENDIWLNDTLNGLTAEALERDDV